MNKLTLGSLFDGSGTFPVAGLLSGIEPVWGAEIQPFPIRVTEKRLPQMKHYGDVSKLNGAELLPVDIITFGSPCQDLSVAGKRDGLVDGSRSNLFFEAVRIIKEMRCATNEKYPRFCVWENVPGALSSGGGEDFRIVLEKLCQIKSPDISVSRPDGKWSKAGEIVGDDFSLAYRVLDACGWGVPQRRKRIYLVADLDGQRAGKILFESEGVSGYSSESFRTWQSTAGGTPSGIGTPSICLNDQGGSYINISDDITGTLRAEIHGHAPAVLESAGFCTEHSAKARSIGYEKEKSPTLRAGTVPAAIALEHHPNDSRIKLSEDNCCQTLTSRCGTGGGNVPLLMETPKTLKIRCGGGCGGKGALIQDDLSATIACNNDQTVFVPTAYGICSKESNAMKSDNPNSGFYKADTARTIDTSNQSPCKNQGGMVVIEGNGSRPSHKGDGYSESDTMYTLNTVETHGVAYGIDRAAFNQGKNALYNFAVTEEVEPTIVAKGPGAVAAPVYSSNKASHFTRADKDIAGTLVATDYKDPPLINDINYIVRRLTPKECALLQGMPAWWCDDLGSDDPSEEEIKKWTAIFEEYRQAVKPDSKPKSRNAIIKWLKDPHSDSAEYTMWGNGIALPNAYFVLSGIAYFAKSCSY